MPLIGLRRLLLRPDIPIAILRIGIAARFLEPGVLIGGVVDDQVDQHTNAALLRAVGELDEIAERAVSGIDAVIVGNIVSIVAMRARPEMALARWP